MVPFFDFFGGTIFDAPPRLNGKRWEVKNGTSRKSFNNSVKNIYCMSHLLFWLLVISHLKYKKFAFEKFENSDLEIFGLFTFFKRKYLDNEKRFEAAAFGI